MAHFHSGVSVEIPILSKKILDTIGRNEGDGANEIEVETEIACIHNYVAIPTDTTQNSVGRATKGRCLSVQ